MSGSPLKMRPTEDILCPAGEALRATCPAACLASVVATRRPRAPVAGHLLLPSFESRLRAALLLWDLDPVPFPQASGVELSADDPLPRIRHHVSQLEQPRGRRIQPRNPVHGPEPPVIPPRLPDLGFERRMVVWWFTSVIRSTLPMVSRPSTSCWKRLSPIFTVSITA